jgi:hypothetical protein
MSANDDTALPNVINDAGDSSSLSSTLIFDRPPAPSSTSQPPSSDAIANSVLSTPIDNISFLLETVGREIRDSVVSSVREENSRVRHHLDEQRLEITDLRHSLLELYGEVRHLTSIPPSSCSLSPASVQFDSGTVHINTTNSCILTSPAPTRSEASATAYQITTSADAHSHSLHVLPPHLVTSSVNLNVSHERHNSDLTERVRYLEATLNKTTAALTCRSDEVRLQQENQQLHYRHSSNSNASVLSPSHQLIPSVLPHAASFVSPAHIGASPLVRDQRHIIRPSSIFAPPSAFRPVVPSATPPLARTVLPTIVPTIPAVLPMPHMPFTMTLNHTLPNFTGKATEMPTKFLTEFEIRATGLVGHSDEHLLRAVQQALSDTALTWYAQTQQE